MAWKPKTPLKRLAQSKSDKPTVFKGKIKQITFSDGELRSNLEDRLYQLGQGSRGFFRQEWDGGINTRTADTKSVIGLVQIKHRITLEVETPFGGDRMIVRIMGSYPIVEGYISKIALSTMSQEAMIAYIESALGLMWNGNGEKEEPTEDWADKWAREHGENKA